MILKQEKNCVHVPAMRTSAIMACSCISQTVEWSFAICVDVSES